MREREATRLYAITSQLASSLDVDRTLDQITASAAELLGADAAAIFMYDAGRGGLACQRALNLPDRLIQELVLEPGQGVVGHAYQERDLLTTAFSLARQLREVESGDIDSEMLEALQELRADIDRVLEGK